MRTFPNQASTAVSRSAVRSSSVSEGTPSSPTVESTAKVLRPAISIDERWSQAIYNATQSSSLVKTFISVVTFTGDEAFFFPLFAIVGFFVYFNAGWLAGGSEADEERIRYGGAQVLKLFGDIGAMCLLEQMAKLTIRRERPPYVKKPRTNNAMPGDWYSFPSGHSLRAAYFSIILSDPDLSPLVTLRFVSEDGGSLLFWVGWTLCVAASRVCVGRHFLSDIIVGLACGIGIAFSSYPHCDPCGPVRVALASIFTLELIAVASNALWRKWVNHWPMMGVIVVTFWMTFPFAQL